MRRRRCLLASLAYFLLVDGPAKAEDTPTPGASWASLPVAIDAQLGAGTPYGVAGLSLAFSPFRYLTLEAGGGYSLYGPQLAVSTRGRYPFDDSNAAALGFGVSSGPYETSNGLDPTWTKTWDRAYWLTSDLAIEHQSPGGGRFRFYVGIEWLLNPSAGVCHSNNYEFDRCNASTNGEVLLYLGVAFGHALPWPRFGVSPASSPR